jgi:hypothetical protein
VVFVVIQSGVWGLELESIIRDPRFEGWLVNKLLGWLSERGVRLPEFVMCELQVVSGGVRFRLLEVVEAEDDWGEVRVFYEASFSERDIEYFYREYLEERAARLKPPRYEGSPLQELQC